MTAFETFKDNIYQLWLGQQDFLAEYEEQGISDERAQHAVGVLNGSEVCVLAPPSTGSHVFPMGVTVGELFAEWQDEWIEDDRIYNEAAQALAAKEIEGLTA